ncbi:Mitochondrial import receptor subunit ATOM69 [Trypanosoma equiperdum]|uniref:CS domain-containing protein n=4 Tax=Trypanozoon TaxID=39700 RepID=Q383D2_TRYB2|nr:hypothetical protein, conserved [Trypanosoma brucei brucei TREU927]EAN80099.1 hypothetical protein, conserved [Trypanosoma brucei brucei TREU927]RHW68085.1 Mitochondrial import receptor subunit ATOM69 [Trypanosoma brucei equiperdum]SCU71638.1 Mitochondrial import receptor subunit ATOM69 [Trypanosoma equiperdum]
MSSDATAAAVNWSQGDEGDTALEICVPIVLPQSGRAKELTVEVKDLAVLRVSHRDTIILQWRLYEPVAEEVEWRVENEGSLLIMDMVKRSCAVWPCLLDLPMRADDKLLRSTAELDNLFREHHPPLPPDPSLERKGAGAAAVDKVDGNGGEAGTAAVGGEDDLERLLEEAAEEVVGEGAATEENNDREFINAELENCRTEIEEIQKKLDEVMKTLEDGADGEAKQQALKQKTILEEMLRLHFEICEKRRLPSSLSGFIEITQLDIRKSRVNVGELSEEEREEYASDEERAMTAHELMTRGLQHFEQQEIQPALHFLRLAALHHNHDQSTIILHSIYSQLNSPRGAFILLRRALQDDNISSTANLKVAEQFDVGARHFLPMFPAALYFYQRAAKAGCVSAMLAIAQLYLRGCTSSTMLSAKQIERLRNTDMYQEWLQRAIDRGCGSANFVKGCAHLKGEHGCVKSYKLAKEYLDRATAAQPKIAQRAPQVYVMLEKLRQEEEGVASLSASTSLSLSKGNYANGRAGTNGDGDAVCVTSSVERLNNMTSKPYASASAGPGRLKKGNQRSGAKAFWEGAVTTGLTLYSLYTLAFPVRLLILPHIYTLLSHVVDRVPWLAASQPLQF